MKTARNILNACDRQLLAAIARGEAQPEVREAFRLQLLAGAGARLEALPDQRQQDFTVEHVEDAGGQLALF